MGRRSLTALVALALVLWSLPLGARPAAAAGSIGLTAIDVAYAQDFNTLATSGTSSITPDGWYFVESSTNANTLYTAGTGSSNTGDTYSFGASFSTERAFGGLLSGALIPTIGAAFVNNTGATITSLDISYTGEQWRVGTLARTDRLDLQFSTTATGLTTGTWTDVDALDFTGPDQGGVVGARDGNAAAYRTPISGAVTGLSIPNGATFWVRWSDFNASGADDGLAVDDFSLTPRTAAETLLSINDISVTEGNAGTTVASFSVSLSRPAPAGGVTFDITTSDGSATVAGADYVAQSVTGATIPAGSSSYSFPVTINGDTLFEPDESFFVDVTHVSGATISDGHGIGTIANDDQAPPTFIHDIQGATHVSPLNAQNVVNVPAIVTAKRSNGFYMQDPNPDANDATSEGIFVFTSSSPTSVSVGDSVTVNGRVQEFRPGGSSTANLTTTELASPTITVLSHANPLPIAIVVGTGGRIPPSMVIEDDASGDVETSGVFDPLSDGIDFWESLEGMRVQLNNAVAVGPTNQFGETPVVGDDGANASVRTARGGLVIRPTDFNPERVVLDDAIVSGLPTVNVGDHYPGSVTGVLDYNFGNFMIELTAMPAVVHDGVTPEITTATGAGQLAVATFNVENLDPTDPQSKFDRLAGLIVSNLRSPDVISVEEVQDNTGPVDDGTVDPSLTLGKLIAAIQAAGGPTYDYRQIDPVNDQDGGEPGGNIRQVFMFRIDRGLSFIDRPGGGSTTPTAVTGTGSGTQLTYSPGRIDPTSSAFATSRKPLAGEFLYNGHHLFVIANHFNSKGGDQPLIGHFQPPTRGSEAQRDQQAQIVRDFVAQILAADPTASVVVDGDLNDFEFSDAVSILKSGGLHALIETLPQNERYSYVFEGNSQTLDHILLSDALFARLLAFDVVHVNAEFSDQASDHEPSVALIMLNDTPTVAAGGPYAVNEGGSIVLSATGSDPEGGPLAYAWDLDGDGTFETPGQSATFSAATLDGPATRTVQVRVTDGGGLTAVASATVTIENVAPTATFQAPASVLAGFPFVIALTDPFDPSTADTTAGFRYAFDCGTGYGAFGSSSSASCATAAAGDLSVAGKIADKDGGTSEYRTTVHVMLSFDSLCTLTRSLIADAGIANSLCQKLDAAAAADARGNLQARANQLEAYRNEVRALQRAHRISDATAELLLALAGAL